MADKSDKYAVDICIKIKDPDVMAEDDIYKVSGDGFYCMGALTSTIYNCAKKVGLSHDKLIELTTEAFKKYQDIDNEVKENYNKISQD